MAVDAAAASPALTPFRAIGSGNTVPMLDDALACLLDRPLSAYPGRYALYYNCGDLSLELFAKDFDPALLAEATIVGPPFTSFKALGSLLAGWDLIAPRWTIDLGRSWFYAPDPAATVPELNEGLTGADLGALLLTRGLTPRRIRDDYPDVELRVQTDGTLLDALRMATGTMSAPDGLFALDPPRGVDPHRDAALSAIADEALRDHLRHLCRTESSARSDGAHYLGPRDPGLHRTHEVVAAWSFGESQSWSAVVAE